MAKGCLHMGILCTWKLKIPMKIKFASIFILFQEGWNLKIVLHVHVMVDNNLWPFKDEC